MKIETIVPAARWIKHYKRDTFSSDLVAALIVTVMLIPQSLAYALLAGLPAEVGIYASILPLVLYALFGSSTSLSVGPVAIASLMTAAAVGQVSIDLAVSPVVAAITLAALSGAMLILFGVLRLGFLANFLSHSVVSAFISASAIIIALSQLRHILGISAGGDTLGELLPALWGHVAQFNAATLVIGLSVMALLFLVRQKGVVFLMSLGLSEKAAKLGAKLTPVLAIVLSIIAVRWFALEQQGVAIVGVIPEGLPKMSLPDLSIELVAALWLPALLISIIGYVESISVGRTLGGKRQERVEPDQELIGLGAANIAASLSGGLPVTGGFSRSVVNFEAGAVTQAASIMTAALIALVSVFLTPALYSLPKATLAATIIIAVMGLVDLGVISKVWRVSKSEAAAITGTMLVTLFYGVEAGVSCGILVSIALHLYRTSKPHIAEVGLIEGSEHFRNVQRYQVITHPQILSIRVDESLFFANAAFLADKIYAYAFKNDEISDIILMCTAVNEIDVTALETLEAINLQLKQQGIRFHLSEVKGPVMDMLNKSDFLQHLSGNVYLSQFDAFNAVKDRIDAH
ncbi:MAG: sulfate permease [Pseudohongiellaceae bacterium]|nr:sulfate permease [Pseudohongiellaceae bacterium]